ncbi:membrane hypothetical protein [Rhodospirillaceae bacterium LM-1]|nr:membrane hypothetical protein [Rhodospirillaceae bacterium LM-1]
MTKAQSAPFRYLRAELWQSLCSVRPANRNPDRWIMLGLALFAVARAVLSSHVPFLLEQDMFSYRSMALDPSSYFGQVSAHHAQRVLPSLVVWFLDRGLGIDVDLGFALLSAAGYLTAVVAFYWALRCMDLSPALALGTTLLAASSQWPVVYALRNIWQANDAWTFALAVLLIVEVERKRLPVLCLLGVLSVFVRQNLPILAAAGFLHLAIQQKSWRPLAALAVMGAVGIANIVLPDGGEKAIEAHLFGDLIRVSGTLEALHYVPLLSFPFLPLFLLPRFWKLARRYWWVMAFSMATIIQAILVAEVGGPYNTQRLMMPALWVMFLLVGQTARATFPRPSQQLAYLALPALVAISRLLAPDSVWHEHRILVGAGMAILTCFALLPSRSSVGLPKQPMSGTISSRRNDAENGDL